MKYIIHRRFKKLAICGEVNLPSTTICESIGDILYYDNKPLCKLTSENAHTYFAIDEDGSGMKRGELTRKINNKLRKRDSNYQTRWDKVWEDSLCRKYKRIEHEDHWLWNHDFYSASIENLEYILKLISI